MTNTGRAFLVFAFAASYVLAQNAPAVTPIKPASSAADMAIRNNIVLYAKSVDAADTALAAQIWEDSPDVTFIHPVGHEHGFSQIKQHVYEQLMGQTFSERKLTPRDISVHVLGDCAWAEFYWDFKAKLRSNGSPVETHGRETQIYHKTPDGWRLVHVHYSGMPVAPPAG